MPHTYRIDPSAGLIYITSHGRLVASEMEQIAEAMMRDPAFRPGLDILSDSRDLTIAPSTDDARIAADLIERLSAVGLGRVAMVATSAAVFGMSQLIGSLAEVRGQQVEVFNRPEEALAWLAEPEAERRKRRPRPSGPTRRPPL